MARFCVKCGKPLQEGEICSCEVVNQNPQQVPQYQYQAGPANVNQTVPQYQPQGQPVYNGQPASQMNGQAASAFVKKLFEKFKSIFLKPATEGASFVVSEDRNSALSLIGVQAIFTTIFALILAAKANPIFELVNEYMDDEVKIPYVSIFFITLIASFALSIALAGIVLGISTLFKNKISFNTALGIAAVRSVVLVPITILAIVLSFLNVGYSVELFYAGNLAGICYMVSAFPVTTQENKNKVALIVFISIVAFAIVSLFIMKNCAQYYVPESMKDGVKELTKLFTNPSSLFGEMMGGY